jgi:hypothetical protein
MYWPAMSTCVVAVMTLVFSQPAGPGNQGLKHGILLHH